MIGSFLTSLFFAGNAVCARRAALHYGATRANLLRLVLAAVLLGAWAHLLGQGLSGGAAGWFFLSGALGFGIGGLAMVHALQRLGSNLSMLIVQCGSAVAAAAAEWAWLGTRLTPVQLALATLTLVGVSLGLAAPPLRPAPASGRPAQSLVPGVLLAVLSAVTQGLGAVLSRKAFAIVRHGGVVLDATTSAYQRTLGGLAVGIAAVAAFELLSRVPPERAPRDGQPGWPWAVANTLLGPVLGVTCYQWALRTTPAGIVLPIVATAPLLTLPLARRLEPGRLTARFVAGALIAVAGAAGLALSR